jgi:formylglycine-generating enzyme required for sulfatase activity
MSRICIASPGAVSGIGGKLQEGLTDLGHAVIDERDLDSTPADLLIYHCPGTVTPDVVKHWLSIANRARADALIVDRNRAVLPANLVFSTGSSETSSPTSEIVERIDAFLRDNARHSDVPHVLHVADELDSPFIANTELELHNLLQEPSVRVVGVPFRLSREIASRPPITRAGYDLARFIRWSADRMDDSFVKLRLSLAGADSPNSVVTQAPLSLYDVLSDSRCGDLIVLRGAPGSGKSMQLRYLETAMALRSIRTGSDNNRQPMVFCVNLGEHAVDETEAPVDWLRAQWARRVQVDRMQPLDYWLREGRAIILLDGFNEIPFASGTERRRWMLKWRRCIHDTLLRTSGNRAVVACRSRDLNVSLGGRDVAPTYVDMTPLAKSEIIALAQAWNPQTAEEMSGALNTDESIVELYQTPFCLMDYLKYAKGAVPRSQSEIFWRRICAVLLRERDRFNFRLFDPRWLPHTAVDHLLGTDGARNAVQIMKIIPLLAALGRVAQSMTETFPNSGQQHRTSLELANCISLLRSFLELEADVTASEALYAAIDLDLLVLHDGLVSFQHHTLQDFFAAMTIADDVILEVIGVRPESYTQRIGDLPEVIAQMSHGDELQLVPSTGFEEIFARAAELRPTLIDKSARLNPWLAAEHLRVLGGGSHGQSEAGARIADELRRRIATSNDVRERIASITTLSKVAPPPFTDDNRTNYDRLLPVAVVPAGEWTVGCGVAGRAAVGSVRSRSTVFLESFAIGRYPVTNVEYAEFMRDGGYRTERFWTLEGWLWRAGQLPLEPVVARWTARRDSVSARPDMALSLLRLGKVSIVEAAAIVRFGRMTDREVERVARELVGAELTAPAYFVDARFSDPQQPVVGVSWHEATAYCNWLSEKTGRRVRLPTENEWEAAALYGRAEETETLDAISVPSVWSDEWGNTAELHVGRPTPVGAFRQVDDRPNIPAEMSGNVFEWVLDPVTHGEEWRRVVKGGSWRHLMRRAHPGYRGRGDTTSRNDDNAFRILAVVNDGAARCSGTRQ